MSRRSLRDRWHEVSQLAVAALMDNAEGMHASRPAVVAMANFIHDMDGADDDELVELMLYSMRVAITPERIARVRQKNCLLCEGSGLYADTNCSCLGAW